MGTSDLRVSAALHVFVFILALHVLELRYRYIYLIACVLHVRLCVWRGKTEICGVFVGLLVLCSVHTCVGNRNKPEERGVIPSSFEHIFTHIARTHDEQYLVRASYLEIYQVHYSCKESLTTVSVSANW